MVNESHACMGVSQPLWHLDECCVRGLMWYNSAFAFTVCYFNLVSCLSSKWGNTVRLLLISDSQRGRCATSKSFIPIRDSWQLLKVLFCALMEGEREFASAREKLAGEGAAQEFYCASKLLSSEY